ncbi:DNA-dependent metalloprotease WSS1 [Dioscorea cayenensis subsp. rotundata]|uniref:DNA-dependent metalloprotease WSS1 n=1 Tax=Dioscorea cayennensis subsp. rotundata TaxID=55577 RepID=A0AB40AQD9_DIOCR|nr:DNA-dependent metalloprotease WSS1 [Dioscorea cayenensis subsp. rotundata]XP_039117223.1 DNA-dependent metalloprotease WSS1 [Dioscorea cayenensis subsp. rotundata]XP_039117232.1 DNA-dependent metalloprotease WSS1 [Dioscorea cayenensis subsp. rotundata]XP_039117241.1 DNA-dependent metalloprotease WSS1 [Dioscorea cayenensis subsp. rotundata]XP_039117249.1 DNA-dependent metalloprotease WSS1 [Dioscorea cayenensis subsp. rotundata]XP_039117257.1 DNA-dependent metalloprotease WSS1 [Dioscorea caye
MDALNKVLDIKPLKKPREDEALKTLERIAKQVQPIMRHRKWRVHLLSEFCHPRLLGLNINKGREVRIRLRAFNNDLAFLPFEQVLDTMLHELCHIEIGPHNAEFYRLWDELRKECDDLVAKGITGPGQGFDGHGRRLGGYTRLVSLPPLRQAATNAAEKRRCVGTLLPSGPKKLGGDNNIMSALSPIQAAAMAAERRMQDELWCGSGSYEDPIVIESKDGMLENHAARESGESSKSSEHVKEGENSEPVVSCVNEKTENSSLPGISSVPSASRHPACDDSLSNCSTNDVMDMTMWECGLCTLLNKPLAPICEACGTQRPKIITAKFKAWFCKFCTLENDIKFERCAACDQWRFSYGPPVSASAFNYGT